MDESMTVNNETTTITTLFKSKRFWDIINSYVSLLLSPLSGFYTRDGENTPAYGSNQMLKEHKEI
jgi:hypothetical protein